MKISNEYKKRLEEIYPFSYNEKINKLNSVLDSNILKFELSNIYELPNLNYNYLFKATSKKHGNIIVKVLLDNDYNYFEMNMLRIYNGNFACKLLEENKQDDFYILEDVTPGTILANVENKLERYKAICNLISNLIIPYNKNYNYIAKYRDIYLKDTTTTKDISFISKYIENANNLYNNILEKNLPLYLLHNDLHSHNVLLSERGYIAIDPHGVIGEKVFEYIPFILNEIWQEKSYTETFIQEILKTISEISQIELIELSSALYIHTVLSTIWFIQDNLNKTTILNNLKILDVLLNIINNL